MGYRFAGGVGWGEVGWGGVAAAAAAAAAAAVQVAMACVLSAPCIVVLLVVGARCVRFFAAVVRPRLVL